LNGRLRAPAGTEIPDRLAATGTKPKLASRKAREPRCGHTRNRPAAQVLTDVVTSGAWKVQLCLTNKHPRARSLANLKRYPKGETGNRSGRTKDLRKFGDIIMKVAQQMARRGGGWRNDRDAHQDLQVP
jgi:hypothetical protein